MNLSDVLLALVLITIVFGPIVALMMYGFRRGKSAFEAQLEETGSPFRARWKTMSGSLRAAIVPALLSLVGGIRMRVKRELGDGELVWQCVGAVALMTILFLIVPFMFGVQRAYQLSAR
ncbi:MAG: hypothetical protein ACAH95_09890 [Fimbriimonas sp.]